MKIVISTRVFVSLFLHGNRFTAVFSRFHGRVFVNVAVILAWKDFFFVKMSEFPENRTKALDFF